MKKKIAKSRLDIVRSAAPAKNAQKPTSMGELLANLRMVIQESRQQALRAVDVVQVRTCWLVGRHIVEFEQGGAARAAYGRALLPQLATHLTTEFGKGFDASNLYKMSQFYRLFPILDALRLELSWTHYRLLLRVENKDARSWYMTEAAKQNWNTRALERQISTLYYERLLASQDRQPVRAEAAEKLATQPVSPREFIRDPVMLEFLGLPGIGKLLESKLEDALISNLQAFLLELGKGFAFVARQQRISTESKDFYLDLVFYNYLLKCFVLFDLKTDELTHQDIGQMDMYVRIYDDQWRGPEDNPTVGIILCARKDQSVVRYSVLHGHEQLFASKYKLILPTEEELRRELVREQEMFAEQLPPSAPIRQTRKLAPNRQPHWNKLR
jgi:predicted nuclease of restriction endonuclease-like (RecB) superfamily